MVRSNSKIIHRGYVLYMYMYVYITNSQLKICMWMSEIFFMVSRFSIKHRLRQNYARFVIGNKEYDEFLVHWSIDFIQA